MEFWWRLKQRGLKCARLEFSGCRVKPQPCQCGPSRFWPNSVSTLVDKSDLGLNSREPVQANFNGIGLKRLAQSGCRSLCRTRLESRDKVVQRLRIWPTHGINTLNFEKPDYPARIWTTTSQTVAWSFTLVGSSCQECSLSNYPLNEINIKRLLRYFIGSNMIVGCY